MSDIFDYFNWRGDITVEHDKFNDVDALILSRLSYIPFDGIVSESVSEKISVYDAADIFFCKSDNKNNLLWEKDSDLLKYAANNERFKNMKLSGYINTIDSENEMQFSAVIIEIGGNLHYISYRGTDNTVIGWQEDFNMYYMFPLPSQKKAAEYLENAAKTLSGDFILGGHSKGGNLAVYAAAFCCENTQDRIVSVYSHDGPGFEKKAIEKSGFRSIEHKIHTYVPQSSIFGMMLEHEEKYTIIKSNQKGFMQHDIYSWEIRRNALIPVSGMTNTSIFFDHTLKQFISALSVEQRRDFIEGVFSLLKITNDETFESMGANWRKNSGIVAKSIREMDKQTRSLIISTLLKVLNCAKDNFSDINPFTKQNRQLKKLLKEAEQ